MKRLLYDAISDGLTPMQKYCITEYYLNGRQMKSIAAELRVNPSTITRHIQRAENRLRKITKYYN
jgi:DNA-directed RNA polymerase specialized sigma24 family protein